MSDDKPTADRPMDEWDEAAKALFRQYWDSDRVLVGRAEERKAFLPIIATALRQAAAKGREMGWREMKWKAGDIIGEAHHRLGQIPAFPPTEHQFITTRATENEPTS